MFVSAPTNTNLPKFEALGCTTTNDNYSLVYNYKCSIIFLCVKPHHLTSQAHIFKLVTIPHPLIIISVMAGVTLERLYQNCLVGYVESCGIYRIMPNVACEVGRGVCGIASDPRLDNYFHQCVRNLLEKIFSCHFMRESELDQLTALSGSGIAFVSFCYALFFLII